MIKGYRDPKSYMPEGKYPDDWEPWERVYPPDWRQYEPPEIPEWFNPTELLLDRNVEKHPKKTALIVDDVKYTYEEFLKMVNKVANALTSLGLDFDNRILLFAPDSIESFAMWLGAHRAGIAPAWVSPLYKKHDLLYFIEDVACKLLFIDEAQLEKLESIKADLPPTLKYVIVRGKGKGEWRSYEEVVEPMKEEFTPVKKHKDDISYFFYSGGTTGRPKCIAHITSDFYNVPHRHCKFLEWGSDDIHYDTSPKFHTHGLWPGILMPLYNGATAIASSKRLTVDLVVEQVEKHRPTILTTVPTVLKWLVTYPEERGRKPDFSSLRMITSAAEKIPMAIHEKFKEIYGMEILDSIGSSEITYEWLANRPKEHKMGSCGKPIYGVEVVLVNPETLEVIKTPNTEGELWVKSKTCLFFYWRKYDKTKATIVGEWVRTGDSLYFDEDGFFWHVGRIDDLFKVHGMWVSPLEVEGVLLKHPAIKDAAVIPKKDESGMTYPKAFVVLKPGYELTDELVKELQQMVREEIGGYKVPRWIEAIDEIPRTTFQKISRLTLRQREEEKEKKSS